MDAKQKLIFLLLIYYVFQKKKLSRKRNQLFLLCCNAMSSQMFLNNLLLYNKCHEKAERLRRRIWSYERQEFWFTNLIENRYNILFEQKWREDFRISRNTFFEIVNLVRPSLEKKETHLRKSISIEKRVAIAIWRLASGTSYKEIGRIFGVAKSTAVSITGEFVREIASLSHRFIRFPRNENDTEEAIRNFREFTNCKIPNVVGAIDGVHIEIQAPNNDSKADYFNRKQHYSINTQATIGANLIFLDVMTGIPGSVHDSRALRNSSLYKKAEENEILRGPMHEFQGSHVRPLVIGDGGYPLLSWLMRPFNFSANLTAKQKKFNKALSGSRVTVERGFGILKARWRCLLKRLHAQLENTSDIIICCIVLHNICQFSGDLYVDEDGMLDNIMQQDVNRRDNIYSHHHDNNAVHTRNLLVDYIEENY